MIAIKKQTITTILNTLNYASCPQDVAVRKEQI